MGRVPLLLAPSLAPKADAPLLQGPPVFTASLLRETLLVCSHFCIPRVTRLPELILGRRELSRILARGCFLLSGEAVFSLSPDSHLQPLRALTQLAARGVPGW